MSEHEKPQSYLPLDIKFNYPELEGINLPQTIFKALEYIIVQNRNIRDLLSCYPVEAPKIPELQKKISEKITELGTILQDESIDREAGKKIATAYEKELIYFSENSAIIEMVKENPSKMIELQKLAFDKLGDRKKGGQ